MMSRMLITCAAAARDRKVVASTGEAHHEAAIERVLVTIDRGAADEHGFVHKNIDRIGRRASLGSTHGELQLLHVLMMPEIWFVCVANRSFPEGLGCRFLQEMAQIWEAHGGIPLENHASADSSRASRGEGGNAGSSSLADEAGASAVRGGECHSKRRSYLGSPRPLT